jgi:hypothetical protein
MEVLTEMHDKYLNLVWYARKPRMGNGDLPSTTELQRMDDYASTPPDSIKGMLEGMMKAQAKYPKECAALDSEKDADWAHGFNSGALAMLRFVQGVQAGGEDGKFAIENFPELDT